MTGYARAQRSAEGRSVSVTLRTVNHRFLDLRWQAPAELEAALPELEKQVRVALARGHVEVRLLCIPEAGSGGLRLDPAVASSYLAAHGELSRRLGAAAPAAAADVLRFPGVLAPASAPEIAPQAWAELAQPALAAALEELNRMRAREGAALAAVLRARISSMRAALAVLTDLRLELQAGIRERIHLRLRELLGAPAPSSERVLQEAALLADRSDISEELTRLDAHLAQCLALLQAGGEVGKKLDFLVQELNREVNTLLSKTSSAAPAGLRVSEIGLELKSELEKFREQIQNLE